MHDDWSQFDDEQDRIPYAVLLALAVSMAAVALVSVVNATTVPVRTDRLTGYGIVSANDTVVTPSHVLDGAAWVRVSGRPAKILRTDGPLTWLSVDTSGWANATIGQYRSAEPVTYGRYYRHATYALVKYRGRWHVFVKLAAISHPGDSGRPILQRDQVVGIVLARKVAELYHDPYGMFRHNRALISVGSKPWLYRPKTLMVGGV